ncbi:MAG: 16S rRNA (cytidine(1402)-2'-O)-methyltransferase [Clostridia bacterium]|nr:16S rRNA (cytidine(1402)-2'-O)-methyltransferase [Clostridia bacterium]
MPKLLVVATPIGNLSDASERVKQAFADADLVAAEDTRVTMKLLDHFGLKKPLVSCHRHNEESRAPEIIARMLEEDLTVALCSDAGTPAVSDPGNRLVEAAWEAGVPVLPVCGPSAAMTALSAAGFFAREFAFIGFPPRETKAVGEILERYRRAGSDVVIAYESPHRVISFLEKAQACWPECRVCVCCDLSKLYERIDRGPIADVLSALRANPNVEKGEYCVVVECPAQEAQADAAGGEKTPEEMLLSFLLTGMDAREAMQACVDAGVPKNAAKKARLAIEKLAARLTEE